MPRSRNDGHVMLIVPRDYQEHAIRSVFNYFSKHKGNPLVLSPTGTGKSIMIGGFCERAIKIYPHTVIHVVTHVKELIDQNYDKMMKMWPAAPAGIHSAGLGRRDTCSQILFGGIQSIYKAPEKFIVPNIVIVDEAHLIGTNELGMYRKLFAYYKEKNPELKIAGYTATGFRQGQGYLTDEGGVFTDVCFDMTTLRAFNWLIEQGYILPLIPRKTELKLDVDGVTRVGGDFNQGELQIAVDKDAITERALKEARELAHDRRKWLIFASGIHHCQRIREILAMMNIECVEVHSRMDPKLCDENILKFRRGKVRAAVNFGKMTTGFDDEDIDCIVMLRPTESPVLWVQMLGRGTRPVYALGFDLLTLEGRHAAIQNSHKPNCLVLDFARNTLRLGPINDPRIPKRKGKGIGDAPVKECPSCGTYNHASVRFCIFCGYEFIFEIKINDKASTEALLKPNAFPQVEILKVEHVTYQLHQKIGAPDMIRVSYWTSAYSYSEYLCFEHHGPARTRAHRWWRDRCPGEPPDTTREAMMCIEMAKNPTHIKVVVNKKYPEILTYCFDGSAFGTVNNPMFGATMPPSRIIASGMPPNMIKLQAQILDEDIPF